MLRVTLRHLSEKLSRMNVKRKTTKTFLTLAPWVFEWQAPFVLKMPPAGRGPSHTLSSSGRAFCSVPCLVSLSLSLSLHTTGHEHVGVRGLAPASPPLGEKF